MGAASLPADKLIGQVLANRYQILHRLGEGAMGAVYKARHVKVGRSFAVKILHERLLQDPKISLRFEREAELAGRLRHPNVIGVVDVGEIDGTRYMVMDFAEGPDLARLLVEAPMPPERIIHLVRQMLEGLYHAHEQGLIHRDFKPENVIIERDAQGAETPRIVDFGIAILRDGGETGGQARLTTNGLVLGTPHYMAPEQAVADPIDHRIDLFALGIVVYEMLSGQLPFDGNGAEVARANLMLDPPPIVQRVPYLEVDPLLEAFALRLMEKKASARPATARAARELLDLIDRDRAAAAAALGVASASGQAVTQSVPAQPRASAYAELPAQPRSLGAPPAAPASPPSLAVSPRRSAPRTDLPTAPPASQLLPPRPAPIAGRAPPAPESSRAAPGGAHTTALQSPLDWPATPHPKRRGRLLVAGVGLGAIGALVAVWLARPGATQAGATQAGTTQNRAPADQVVSITSRPDTANTGSAPGPSAPGPSAPGPSAPAPSAPASSAPAPSAPAPSAPAPRPAPPATSEPAATDLAAVDREATDSLDGTVAHTEAMAPRGGTKHLPTRDARPHAPRIADARAHGTNLDTKLDENTTEAKAAVPPKAASSQGTTPSELHGLYYSIPSYLNQLPKDRSEELWTRWRRFNVNALMAGPQAERDQAADLLSQIRKEAQRLVKASGKSVIH